MSNLNDFLSGSYKQKKTRTTKTISSEINDGGKAEGNPQQAGEEYFSQTVNNIQNNSVVIRGTFDLRYSHQGYLVVRIWRNALPSGTDGSDSDPMSRANLVYESYKYFPHGHLSGINSNTGKYWDNEVFDFAAIDENAGGTSAEYKVCFCRTNSNSFSIQPGTFIHFDTYDLFDLTD